MQIIVIIMAIVPVVDIESINLLYYDTQMFGLHSIIFFGRFVEA